MFNWDSKKSYDYNIANNEMYYGQYESALIFIEKSNKEDCKELYEECVRLINKNKEYRRQIEEKIKDFIEKYKDDIHYYNDEVYYGYLVNGYRQGLGLYIFNNIKLDKYLGFWDKGYMEGRGELYFKNGDVYIGNFKKGKFFGMGTLYTKVNEVYKGNFCYGKFNGLGIYYYRDGSKKYGEWSNGVLAKEIKVPTVNIKYCNDKGKYNGEVIAGGYIREGYGRFEYSNGDIYEGNWSNDCKNGKGYLISNGYKTEGKWIYGRLVEVTRKIPFINKNK